ncbi:hypothetical protein BDZ97DRAFT_1667258, partial [Flammula alnicola]
PVARLDTDMITDATAARLATSLLGHVLFLKNQVPFPVMQLGRLPGGKANSRAFKQRAELLASYDTISSHLDTTFSALSTAIARCSGQSGQNVAQAHVAILVGPSLGSAKSKVMLGIDGLEKRIWGTREEAFSQHQGDKESDDEEEEEEEGEESEESEEETEESGEEPEESEDEDEEDQEEDDEEESVDDEPPSSSPPPPYTSYAEEQKFLQNADRLLSRTLASADAAGNGITSEMTPTQTHVLIRAPRRFNHPAWIPRQNITAALDSSLQDFLNNSGLANPDVELEPPSKHSVKRGKVEGVWVTARNEKNSKSTEPSIGEEDDDMIWWSWDGKFVGFNDW